MTDWHGEARASFDPNPLSCSRITERAPALSTPPGAHSQCFVIFSFLLSSPSKKRKGGQGRPEVGEGVLGCLMEGNSKEKKVSDFSLGSPAAGDMRAQADAWGRQQGLGGPRTLTLFFPWLPAVIRLTVAMNVANDLVCILYKSPAARGLDVT
ncbi:uncharacterized [Tachysurus ichikawai]